MENQSKRSRRRLLKSIAVGGGAITTAKALPEKWISPVLNAVSLPAHAQLTGCYEYFGTGLSQEPLSDRGKADTWYAKSLEKLVPEAHAQQGSNVDFCVTVCGSTATVIFRNNAKTFDFESSPNINGSPANVSISDAGENCELSGDPGDFGPQSVRIKGYTLGDPTINVVVEGGSEGGGGWSVTVPEGNCQSFGPLDNCNTNCLLDGSLVVMADGRYEAIETLEVGSLVQSMNSPQYGYGFAAVTKIKKRHFRASHYCINGALLITDDHPVLVRRDQQLTWVRVDGLAVGDMIKSPDGYVEVSSMEKRNEGAMTVYLETNTGNFIVKAGDARYVVKSTYATPETRNETYKEQELCLV